MTQSVAKFETVNSETHGSEPPKSPSMLRRGSIMFGGEKKIRVFRSEFHRFMCWFTEHWMFNAFVLLTVFANVIMIAVATDDSFTLHNKLAIDASNLAFLSVYLLEFILKFYAQPKGYWKNGFNRFDFVILLLSLFQILQYALSQFSFFSDLQITRVLRAASALRALRSISFVRSLQVIVTALVKTIMEVVNLLLLLLLIMYVFAIVGLNFFSGDPSTVNQWGDLLNAMYALFQFVTADNWTDQQELLDNVSIYTRFFTIAFIFIGNWIFTNLFIGIVIQNLDDATEEDKKIYLEQQKRIVETRKAQISVRQQEDLNRLLGQGSQQMTDAEIQITLQKKAGKLSHKDRTPTTELACNLTWLETYMGTINHQENAMYRLQQLHFEVANTLTELLERRIQTRATS